MKRASKSTESHKLRWKQQENKNKLKENGTDFMAMRQVTKPAAFKLLWLAQARTFLYSFLGMKVGRS